MAVTYLVLFMGDDSDFALNQTVYLTLDTKLPLDGMKAHVKVFGYQQDFDTIPADKRLELKFPASETSRFVPGMALGSVWLEDGEGRIRTVTNRLNVLVTKSVPEAYDSEDEQAVTVTFFGGMSWDDLDGKPPLVTSVNGVPATKENGGAITVPVKYRPFRPTDAFDMNCNDWQFRNAFARVWEALGGSVTGKTME